MYTRVKITNPYGRVFGSLVLLILAIGFFKVGNKLLGFEIISLVSGISMNTLAILMNKKRMPVYVPRNIIDAYDLFLDERRHSQYVRYQDKDDPEIQFKFLTTRFRVGEQIFSIGDIINFLSGAFILIEILRILP